VSRPTPNAVSAVVGALAVALTVVSVASATFNASATAGPMSVQTATLNPPTALSATPTCVILGAVTVQLSWTATTSGFADGYEVLRSIAPGPYISIGTVSGRTTTSYTDTGVTRSTTYNYVVRATKNNWRSVDSNEASATTKSALCI
jgi:hypothetical protein